jgi:hypothetical protein
MMTATPPEARARVGAVAALLLMLAVTAGPIWPGRPAAAQQFTADLVGGIAGSGLDGKAYVANGKVRIESSDFPNDLFLSDADARIAYFVKPRHRIFMEAKRSSRLSQILVPVDPDDPCVQWQVMAEIAGPPDRAGHWRCNRVGPERVDERSVIKFQAVSPHGRPGYYWIDPQLRFPVKVQFEDGVTVDLRNIEEGPQAASLFEIPANFRKFDPRQLIDRIKQSDVWVEPPD